MTVPIIMCDTSHWSGAINFQKMREAGAVGWFTKATDSARGSGKLFEDTKLEAYCNQVFALKQLLAGCFHWLQPDTDPITAARFYLARYFRHRFHLPPILDFEEPFAYWDKVNGVPTHLESHFSWCGQVWAEEVKRNVETVWIYSAKWFTDHFDKRLLGWMNEHFVITAQYPGIKIIPSEDQLPSFPYPWSERNPEEFDWAWQFSADDNNRGEEFGVTADHIDLDYYRNGLERLLSLPGVKALDEEDDQEMVPTGTYDIVLTGSMCITKDPAIAQTTGNIVYGYGISGDKFVATEKTETGFYKVTFKGVDAWISGNTQYTIITEIMAPHVDPEPVKKLTLAEFVRKIKAALHLKNKDGYNEQDCRNYLNAREEDR